MGEDPRRFMDPHVEYRPAGETLGIPADRYLFGRDGSAWYRRGRGGTWKRFWIKIVASGHATIEITIGGKDRHLCLGPLILSAFGSPRPLGFRCHHRNGNLSDVRLENLEWRRAGSCLKNRPARSRGSERPNAKVSESQVIEMRTLYMYGDTLKDLAERYGISDVTAHGIVTGRRWGHVPGAVGTRSRGLASGNANSGAKLDEIDVAEIKRLLKAGAARKSIAAKFGVAEGTVGRIAKGQSWIHVPDPRPEPGANVGGDA